MPGRSKLGQTCNVNSTERGAHASYGGGLLLTLFHNPVDPGQNSREIWRPPKSRVQDGATPGPAASSFDLIRGDHILMTPKYSAHCLPPLRYNDVTLGAEEGLQWILTFLRLINAA